MQVAVNLTFVAHYHEIMSSNRARAKVVGVDKTTVHFAALLNGAHLFSSTFSGTHYLGEGEGSLEENLDSMIASVTTTFGLAREDVVRELHNALAKLT